MVEDSALSFRHEPQLGLNGMTLLVNTGEDLERVMNSATTLDCQIDGRVPNNSGGRKIRGLKNIFP